MTLRLRCLAGPNGSGKSTLFASMQEEYKVDFYTFVNADEINVSRAGVPCGLVSIPQRNMHTPAEVCDLMDIENVARLLAAFIREVGA